MDLYFSDHFKVKPQNLEKYGAFNISLVADLPLFIDPFLLFNSRKKKYKQLHSEIIRYLIFLRDKASEEHDKGKLKSWYAFKRSRAKLARLLCSRKQRQCAWNGFCASVE